MPSASDASAAGDIPAIRTFQFDSSSIGQLSSAVNLFRGDVNVPHTLFTLPGRHSGGGLDVAFTIFYQSNVARAAAIWNRDSPTSVVGLGWDLPLTYIDATSTGSPDPDTRSYVLYDNGTPNPLIRQPQQPYLFTIPSGAIGALQPNEAVPASIRSLFLQSGLPLSAAATVNGSGGSWTVDDEPLQQSFLIDGTNVLYGGQAYQLQNYKFWHILYFPAYERWLIVTDDGIRKSFGGGLDTSHGYRTSAGNSIAWEVWWANNGILWTGPSSLTSGQVQVATSWYLASVADPFGDTVSYTYNGFQRNPSGLLPEVEQQVGAGGLPYTKAVYLTQITDAFGRTATLTYGDKSASEYADPHRDQPSNDPNAYQDRYETKYLSSIALEASDGTLVTTIDLAYTLQNVTSSGGAFANAPVKRYLTGITEQNAAGASLPGYTYEYYWDADAPAAQPGALQTITFPQGGIATYEYSQLDLNCRREQSITRPTSDSSPSVYYGDDYVVTVWSDPNDGNGTIRLQVWSWYGRWIPWPQATPEVIDSNGFEGSSINVLTASQFFVLTFERPTSESVTYVFNKAPGSPGTFVPAVLNGNVTAANVPTLTFDASSGSVSYVAGATFFAAAQMDSQSTQNPGMYQVVSYSWVSQTWSVEPVNTGTYTVLAASGEYLLALDLNGNVTMRYLDGTLNWHVSTVSSGSLAFPGGDPGSVALLAAPGMAVANLLQYSDNEEQRFRVAIVQWDAAHTLQITVNDDVTESESGSDMLWFPTVAANRLVAVNGLLYRFDGASWVCNSDLMVGNPLTGTGQRYAYGPDYAIRVDTDDQGYASAATVLGYDPENDASNWSQKGSTPVDMPGAQQQSDDFASASDDYAVLGPNLYFRGTATDWAQVMTPPGISDLSALSPGFISQTMVNEGPDFLSYSVGSEDINTGTTAAALILQNGQVLNNSAVTLGTEQLFTAVDGGGPSGPGVSPQGPGVFVTYTVDSSDLLDAIVLHHYAGADVTGPLIHYPLTGLTIDDRYGNVSTTCYKPDATQAACDASGLVVKYYQNTVYPGTDDPGTPIYGSTTNSYMNGLNYTNGNYFDMLDGLLLQTQIRDSSSTVLENHENEWTIYSQVASHPTDGSAPPLPLYGGWVAQTVDTNLVDGVSTTTTSDFVPDGLTAPYTGRPSTISTTSCNGAGEEETWTTLTAYGVEAIPAMAALNMRSLAAQVTTQQSSSAGTVAVKSSASSFTLWTAGNGEVSVPAQEASFHFLNASTLAFPYGTYEAGSTPAGWLLDTRVLERTARGQVRSSADPCGTVSFTVFSQDLSYPVARIANAAPSAAAYLGFEPYESTAGWTLENAVTDTANARAGTVSLRLPGGVSAQLGVTVTPAPDAGQYMVGFWYKTAASFTSASGAGCTVTGPETPLTSAFEETGGEWVFTSIGVPAGASSLTVTIANTTAADVWLDSVHVVPLVGSLIARTYDPITQSPTSTMDAAGRTRWLYYDAFQRRTLQVGPNGQPKELAQRFLSRAGSASGAFDPDSPNAELTLHPADGGSMETFRDGDGWQTSWKPGSASAWQPSGGTLLQTASASDTLTYEGAMPATFGVYFEASPGNAPVLALTVGNVAVSWSGSAYTCTAADSAVAPLVHPPAMARHWLFIAGEGTFLFFADGQLIFSQTGTFAFAAPAIAVGPGMSLTHLALLASPRVGLSYNDGSARQRQVHQLHGADSRVTEMVYDPLDRLVATTRVAPGSFGSGASLPPLQYRAGFVDISAFLSTLSTTGVMNGDVADYYAGQVEGGIQRSNDEGYPYWGTRWEASPRHRQLEMGRPGKRYAIANPSTGATTQFTYGASNGTDLPLTAGQYSQITVTTPIGTNSYRVNDKLGQSVAAAQQSGNAITAESIGLRSYSQGATGPQSTLNLQLPNALLQGPQSQDADFVRTTVADGAGRAISANDPNVGTTQFLYDPCGRIRFVQPALDQGAQGFLYNTYDAMGRLLEQGIIPQAWDASALASHAADMSWPGPEVSRTTALLWSYDGDGNTPAAIGQKTSCITTTAVESGDPCIATETFSYDNAGHLIEVALALSGPTTGEGITGYVYNNLNQITSLSLPTGSPLSQVVYAFDDQGWTASIGSSPSSPSDIASYTYTPDGGVETETLGNGAWTRSVQYMSPGWVQGVDSVSADDTQRLTLAYTYNDDGTIQSRNVTYAFAEISDTLSDTYTYDGQGRLQTAAGSSNDQITSYDPNGNIWGVSQAGVDSTLQHAPGKDQLTQTTIDGQSATAAYDARGRMTASLDRTLSYDDTTNLTTGVSAGAQKVQFGYGGHGQRVMKIAAGQTQSQTLYYTGSSDLPNVRVDGSQWSAMVYGPTGLVALYADGPYYPLRDNEQSVWAVVDSSGLAARYVYLPFGATMADGAKPDILPYRYMGQEWDPEIGLYNFRARMYDPVLRRFLSPDPGRQFPSPYVFCGNNPLGATDPSGEISLWAEIGIGIAMAAVAVAGVALTFVTLGAAAPGVAAAEGGLAAAEAGIAAGTVATEAAGAAAAEGGAAAAAEGGAVAAEGGAAAASEVGAGAAAEGAGGAGAAAEASTTSAFSWSNFGLQTLAGGMQGMGESGLQYDIEHARDFTAAGFFEAADMGAVSGLAGGALGQVPLLNWITSPLLKYGATMLLSGIEGAALNDVSQVVQNKIDHHSWYKGLAESTIVGFGESAALSGFTEGIKSREALGNSLRSTIGEENIAGLTTMVDRVQQVANSRNALGVYGTAGFFIVSGFGVWGAVQLEKQ